MSEKKVQDSNIQKQARKLHISMIGDYGTGKTTLFRILDGESYLQTTKFEYSIGKDFIKKKTYNQFYETEYIIWIWDTAGGVEAFVVLVATKIDLEHERCISYEQAMEFAKSLNIPYFETSSLKNINVFPMMDQVIEMLIQKDQEYLSYNKGNLDHTQSNTGNINLHNHQNIRNDNQQCKC
eukprot:403341776